jgi:hypothetical protein
LLFFPLKKMTKKFLIATPPFDSVTPTAVSRYLRHLWHEQA